MAAGPCGYLDPVRLQPGDELALSDTMLAHGGVDALDPHSPKSAFCRRSR
jgi:hypothetical protein